MSSTSSPTLLLDLRKRRWEARIAVALSAVAAAAPFLLVQGIGLQLAAGASLTILATCLFGFVRARWLGKQRLVSAAWQSDSSWLLTDASGRTYVASLSASSRMSPFAVWLHWRLEDPQSQPSARFAPRSLAMLLLRPDLAGSDFRRLLVRLRMDRSEWQPLTTLNRASMTRCFVPPNRDVLLNVAIMKSPRGRTFQNASGLSEQPRASARLCRTTDMMSGGVAGQ